MARFLIVGVVLGFAVALLLLRRPESAQAPAPPPPATGRDRLEASGADVRGKVALTRRAQVFPTPVAAPLWGPDGGTWVPGPSQP